MSPVPVDYEGGGERTGGGLTSHLNVFLQLITVGHLLQHVLSIRLRRTSSSTATSTFSYLPSRSSQTSTSLILATCTLGVLLAYLLGIRPLQGDVHFLTLASRTPHPQAQPIPTDEYYNFHQRLYSFALVCIYASAVIQLLSTRDVDV